MCQHTQFDLRIICIHKYITIRWNKYLSDQASQFHTNRNILKIRLCTADPASCRNRLIETTMNPTICLLVLGMWGSAYILNTPVIEVYRNGFYLFCFLAGYILFSHEQIQSLLAKWAPCMLAVSGVLAVVYTVHFWGQNYAALINLKAPLTNLYAWFACLGVLGAGKRWLDKETAFTRCMASRSFGIYVLHNPLLVLLAWAMDKLLHFPVWSMYLLLPVLLALLLPPLIALIKRIPVLRTLVLGEK